MTDRDSLRKSRLYESFSQNNTNPEESKAFTVNAPKMPDFFGAIGKKTGNSVGDSTQVSKENNVQKSLNEEMSESEMFRITSKDLQDYAIKKD